MAVSITPPADAAAISVARVNPAPAPARHHMSFREFLSELNPLQYIPVVGSLYRAVTGDTIPETAREAGSLVVSGLTGGPIGVAINLVALAAEKITGFDPEKIETSVLAGLGIGHSAAAAHVAAVPAHPHEAKSAAWSHAQLAAYGVTTTAGGTLRHGNMEGSDVLNSLELARIARPATGMT